MSLPHFLADDHTTMMNFIEKTLCCFESCFSRKAAFRWFVVITIGLMLRSDQLGVTSVIRDLAPAPGCYDSMLHFFRASSWSLGTSEGAGSLLSGSMHPYMKKETSVSL